MATVCASCGAENRAGRRFCSQCAAALAVICPACGAAGEARDRFCGECAAPLELSAGSPTPLPAQADAVSERRVVSVLFADLVGFTTLSESRDAEDVRELLSRYFDTSRRLVERYGGTVEKFIGDAVMAVWGTPIANEDDAERAVRAALDLTAAVAALGEEVGAPDLRARAGVLTGEAAVTVGARGEGMVAGDLVNTAARIQSAAVAGAVLVGEATRRASEAAIVYEDAGARELKGKAEQVAVWRALRVAAGVGGSQRARGLEAPFVGRDRELRLVKELFHASAEDRRAQLVSATGIAGIGKSRLAWEFEKYIDGLAGTVLWHRGRCLSYGDGVAYWALAEMVRMRARIAEGESADSAAHKLREVVAEHVPDAGERSWIQPRLGHLLGLDDGQGRDRDDLFPAWRAFFERMADRFPTVMVIEDVQWADASLLDFVEYLHDWSRNHSLFILTLARPELADRRAEWGVGKPGFTSLHLEPLPRQAMHGLLTGLVPGLADELVERILERAQGVPLYAVETVRMLLERGLLVREGASYRPAGPVGDLDVPDTLHALIAARLDGLTSEERSLVQDASVLGKTFTRPSLEALAGTAPEHLEAVLQALVRKEIMTVQADPLSPERGQYGFLQELMRTVAYETISKRDRRARHLRVAAVMAERLRGGEEEIVEVIAAHYVEAHRLAPDAPDAAEVVGRGRDMLVRAGERAASLAAADEAFRYFQQAAALADDDISTAELTERAGEMAFVAARLNAAAAQFDRAVELYDACGLPARAARVSARGADVDIRQNHVERAASRLESAFTLLSTQEPDENLAAVASQLGRVFANTGRPDLALERLELSLELAERLRLPIVLASALISKATVLVWQGRREEGRILCEGALEIARDHDLPAEALRAHNNLALGLEAVDRYVDALELSRSGLTLARRVGDRRWEQSMLLGDIPALIITGAWDEAVSRANDALAKGVTDFDVIEILFAADVHAERGDIEAARRVFGACRPHIDPDEWQNQVAAACVSALLLQAEGRPAEAMDAALEGYSGRSERGTTHLSVKRCLVAALDAALAIPNLEAADRLLAQVDALEPGEISPFIAAQADRFTARVGAARDEHHDVHKRFTAAETTLRDLGTPFFLARTLLEHAAWLVDRDRGGDATVLLDEAAAIFGRLHAQPWIERLELVRPAAAQPAVETAR